MNTNTFQKTEVLNRFGGEKLASIDSLLNGHISAECFKTFLQLDVRTFDSDLTTSRCDRSLWDLFHLFPFLFIFYRNVQYNRVQYSTVK